MNVAITAARNNLDAAVVSGRAPYDRRDEQGRAHHPACHCHERSQLRHDSTIVGVVFPSAALRFSRVSTLFREEGRNDSIEPIRPFPLRPVAALRKGVELRIGNTLTSVFLRWLHVPQHGVDEAAKRFANMVMADFDEIAATSRQRNARSAALASLARLHLAASPAELPEIDMPAATEEWSWRRLKELTVGPFRGFRREEQFDLRRRVILFYGPNGSGKASLCEALERGLLGSVEEAELKRIDERRYLANTLHSSAAREGNPAWQSPSSYSPRSHRIRSAAFWLSL